MSRKALPKKMAKKYILFERAQKRKKNAQKILQETYTSCHINILYIAYTLLRYSCLVINTRIHSILNWLQNTWPSCLNLNLRDTYFSRRELVKTWFVLLSFQSWTYKKTMEHIFMHKAPSKIECIFLNKCELRRNYFFFLCFCFLIVCYLV